MAKRKKVSKKAGTKRGKKKASKKAGRAVRKTTKKAPRKKMTRKKAPARKSAGARKKTPARKKTVTRRKATAGKTRTKRTGGPFPMRVGKGATPGEIGANLVASFNSGVPDEEIWTKWYSPRIESIEGSGQGWRGARALRAKNAAFHEQYTVHSASAEGPYVGATGFAVRFTIDMENKSTGERNTFTEVGVYRVKNGRIVREEFMYAC